MCFQIFWVTTLSKKKKKLEKQLQKIKEKILLFIKKNNKVRECYDEFVTDILEVGPHSFNNDVAQIFFLKSGVDFSDQWYEFLQEC